MNCLKTAHIPCVYKRALLSFTLFITANKAFHFYALLNYVGIYLRNDQSDK